MIFTCKKYLSVFGVVACAVSLGGCLARQSVVPNFVSAAPGAGTVSSENSPLIETDPAQVIETVVRQEFCIIIPSNITTGYSWEYLPSPGMDKVRPIENSYHAPETNLPGAGGMESWTFRAQEAGKTEITLGYRRPWEKNIPPVETRKFAVTIQPK